MVLFRRKCFCSSLSDWTMATQYTRRLRRADRSRVPGDGIGLENICGSICLVPGKLAIIDQMLMFWELSAGQGCGHCSMFYIGGLGETTMLILLNLTSS